MSHQRVGFTPVDIELGGDENTNGNTLTLQVTESESVYHLSIGPHMPLSPEHPESFLF